MVNATFVRIHGGRLVQYAVPGVGKVYVTLSSFPNKQQPDSLDVTVLGLREPSAEPEASDGKAAERAAKAEAKAAKAQERATKAAERAQAIAAKAQAKAQAAAERAAKAAGTVAPEAQPEL